MRPPKKAAATPAAKPTPKSAAKKPAGDVPAKKAAVKKAAPAKELKRGIGTPEEIFAKIVELSKGERLSLRVVSRIIGEAGECQAFTEDLRHVESNKAKSFIENVMDIASAGWRSKGFFLDGNNAVFYVTGDKKKIAEQMDRYLQHLELMAKQNDELSNAPVEGK